MNTAENRHLVCGYPKTGRTWLRFMLSACFVRHYGLGINLDLTNAYSVVGNVPDETMPGQPSFAYDGTVPKIEMSHAPHSVEMQGQADIIFLTRDPRDIMVSHWLHNTYQRHIFGGTINEFITDPDVGIEAFLLHLSSWAPHLVEEQVVSYESMRLNPANALKRVITEFRLSIPENVVVAAAKLADIEHMREREVERGIAGHDYDRTNPEALRVRRGVVGGYVDYLSVDDEAYIQAKILNCDRDSQKIIALTGYSP